MNQIDQYNKEENFSKIRFEAIAQTASDSIVISDEDSNIVFANKKTYEIFGYAEGSLTGSNLGILMPEKYRQGHKAGVQRFIQTGNPKLIGHTIEIEGIRKNGAIFPLELSLSAWKEGQRYFFSGIIRDISKRNEAFREKVETNRKLQYKQVELEAAVEELKAAEEHLRTTNDDLEHRVALRTNQLEESERKVKESEEQLRLITDTVPVLISYLGSDVTYKFVNKAYEDVFRVKVDKIIGKPVREIIGEKAFHNIMPLLEKVLRGENVKTELLQDYGEAGVRWMKFSLVPHKVQNEVVGIVTLVEDITSFKNIQKELVDANQAKQSALEELKEKNHELERINIDLDNFIYTASHDLKSPVANLEGLISLLSSASEKIEPKERKVLEMMDLSIQKLQKTISDLVEITKVQKELQDAVEEPLQIETITREVKEDLDCLIQSNDAIIKEEYTIEEIIYKKSSLRSIVYNLLSNAIKYRNPERPLTVNLKTYVQDGFVVFSVKDNGLGLSPKHQKKLFTLFTRMHHQVEGTGVGLFMIKRIIENCGGRIEVNSEEGKGTEFQIFLTRHGEGK